MLIEMTIKGLMVDPITNMPVVILKDREGERVLPIWVGIFEANAIALQIENIATTRPMTHDLLRNIISDLKADVEKIVVSDLQDNTFYALIHLRVGGEVVAIDARPSDAIAPYMCVVGCSSASFMTLVRSYHTAPPVPRVRRK